MRSWVTVHPGVPEILRFEVYYRESLFISMKYGLEKCMENWLERVWKPIEIFGIG